MKNVLCFGDSNTWGYDPATAERFPHGVRWTSVAQSILKEKVKIIEEGLSGRTSCWDDPISDGKNGRKILPEILRTHSPLDLAVIMLGTNDLKTRFNLSPFVIAQGAATLAELCTGFDPAPSHILIVSPPNLAPTDNYETSFTFERGVERSKELAVHYRYFAEKLGCNFMDAAQIVTSSPIDGIHWEKDQHLKFGEEIAARISSILEL